MPNSHLINANIHRAKEGARVLEDIARFLLRDEVLFQQIREIRHGIQISAPIYKVKKDLGGSDFIEDNVRANLIDIIQANAMRLQEALRVLEETHQAPHKQLLKKLRYRAYELHLKLYTAAKEYLKQHLLAGLYLIIDTDIIPYSIKEMIEIINQSPINIVQYRNKFASKKIIFKNANEIKKNLAANKLLIINDHIDVALDIADGIHLGQEDYPLERIRNIVPHHFVVGISCHNLNEAKIAAQYGASYIAIGCLFPTESKSNITPVPLQELKKICQEISIPVCAIGGINHHNLDEVLKMHVKMAALISSVWRQCEPLKSINAMHDKIIENIDQLCRHVSF